MPPPILPHCSQTNHLNTHTGHIAVPYYCPCSERWPWSRATAERTTTSGQQGDSRGTFCLRLYCDGDPCQTSVPNTGNQMRAAVMAVPWAQWLQNGPLIVLVVLVPCYKSVAYSGFRTKTMKLKQWNVLQVYPEEWQLPVESFLTPPDRSVSLHALPLFISFLYSAISLPSSPFIFFAILFFPFFLSIPPISFLLSFTPFFLSTHSLSTSALELEGSKNMDQLGAPEHWTGKHWCIQTHHPLPFKNGTALYIEIPCTILNLDRDAEQHQCLIGVLDRNHPYVGKPESPVGW